MAEKSYPWEGNSGSGGIGDCGPYTGDDADQINKALVLGKTGVVETSHLEVSETSPASKSVRVALGRAIIRGKVYWLDADTTLTISDNTSGNPRIDRVVVEVDWTAQTGRLKVVEGTPAASPSAPTLTQTDGVLWQFPLAQIAVANGFTSITSSDITDEREFADPSPGSALVTVSGKSTDYSTNSTTFVAIDSTEFKLSVTTHGGDLLVWFNGAVGWNPARLHAIFDVEFDGVRVGDTDGLAPVYLYGDPEGAAFIYRITGVSAGAHTVELVWRASSANNIYLRVGGTTGQVYKAQFGVMEVGL